MATRAVAVSGEAALLAVGDTIPNPEIQLLDENNAVIADLTGHAAEMDFVNAMGDEFTVAGVVDDGTDKITFDVAGHTSDPTYRRTWVKITNPDGIYTLPSLPFAVVDYALLWADPAIVMGLAGDEYTYKEAVFAILVAETAVRAWVTTPITSPVSERVRRATALLAARALTEVPDADPIQSETMGDYTVRYLDPAGTGMDIGGSGEIEDLLRPWRPQVYDTYVGPTGVGPNSFVDLVSP